VTWAVTVDRQLRRSSVVAAVGDGIAAVALPLIAIDTSKGDPLAVAAVVAAQHLPWVLVQLSGRRHLVDRRTLVGLTDTVRALALGTLGLLVAVRKETVLAILVTAFLVGLGEAWTDRLEAESGAAGTLGPRSMVAIGLIGFPLGGLLYDTVTGPATPLFVDVFLFTVASTFALAVHRPVKPGPVDLAGPPLDSPLPPAATPLLASAAVGSFVASGVLGLLALFATVDLGLGAPGFGVLLAALAASTAAGGFVAPTVGEWLGVRTGLVAGLLVAAGALAVASMVADADKPWQGALALGLSAAGAMTATVLGRARLQLVVGREAAPGALERLHLVTWSAIPLGALVAGWAARHLPIHRVLILLALAWVAAAVTVIALDRASGGASAIRVKRPVREIV
jgi:hypothetical protein